MLGMQASDAELYIVRIHQSAAETGVKLIQRRLRRGYFGNANPGVFIDKTKKQIKIKTECDSNRQWYLHSNSTSPNRDIK